MKVRCAYCKAEFELEPGVRGHCPACQRIAFIRPPRKHTTRRDRQVDPPRPSAAVAAAFFSSLGYARRIVMFIGIIAAVYGLTYIKKTRVDAEIAIPPGKSDEDKARRELAAINIAIARYRSDCGQPPTVGEGWRALLDNPGYFGWRGPYVIPGITPDPWGTWYRYEPIGTDAWRIVSSGPDKQADTPDDIIGPPPTNATW